MEKDKEDVDCLAVEVSEATLITNYFESDLLLK